MPKTLAGLFLLSAVLCSACSRGPTKAEMEARIPGRWKAKVEIDETKFRQFVARRMSQENGRTPTDDEVTQEMKNWRIDEGHMIYIFHADGRMESEMVYDSKTGDRYHDRGRWVLVGVHGENATIQITSQRSRSQREVVLAFLDEDTFEFRDPSLGLENSPYRPAILRRIGKAK